MKLAAIGLRKSALRCNCLMFASNFGEPTRAPACVLLNLIQAAAAELLASSISSSIAGPNIVRAVVIDTVNA